MISMFIETFYLILSIIFASFLGFIVNGFYQKLGYEWAENKNQKIISLVLAPVVLIITKTIADNLALSLGMIGALSIVRFRNPVKSPLELVIYFVYITIGISSGVNIIYAIILTLFVISAPLILKLNFLNKFKMGTKNNIESGDYYLNIELDNKDSKTVAEIENKINDFKLISKFFNKENEIISYVVAIDKESSKDLLSYLEKYSSEIINYNLSIQNDGE
jgi:hypothetical protein